MTRNTSSQLSPRRRSAGTAFRLATCSVLIAVLMTVVGCSGSPTAPPVTGSVEGSPVVGANMAGAAVDVHVTPEAIASKPKAWVLTTPESTVRSYLDWTSYAFRVGQSEAAKATMGADEEVRVDSYVQYNFQQSRLIDQTLDSITFGTPTIVDKRATISAKETWTYRYVSIETAGKTIGGPYTVRYETTYTVVKSDTGGWVVDSVEAKALDTVK